MLVSLVIILSLS